MLRSDVLQACLKNPEQTLADLKRPMAFVPDLMKVDALFQHMLNEKLQMAMVQDEYGSSIGLVTLEDAMETLVGVEIVDEHDQVADLQQLARELWKKRARQMGDSTGERVI